MEISATQLLSSELVKLNYSNSACLRFRVTPNRTKFPILTRQLTQKRGLNMLEWSIESGIKSAMFRQKCHENHHQKSDKSEKRIQRIIEMWCGWVKLPQYLGQLGARHKPAMTWVSHPVNDRPCGAPEFCGLVSNPTKRVRKNTCFVSTIDSNVIFCRYLSGFSIFFLMGGTPKNSHGHFRDPPGLALDVQASQPALGQILCWRDFGKLEETMRNVMI